LLIPRLEALGAVKDGKAILAKIDIDEMPDLAGNYGVCSFVCCKPLLNAITVSFVAGHV
jgi:hypothetical protein